MLRISAAPWALALLLVLTGGVACVSDPGFRLEEEGEDVRPPRDTSPDPDTRQDTGGEDGDETPQDLPTGTRIRLVSGESVVLPPNSQADLEVQLYSFEGEAVTPISGARLRFEVPASDRANMAGSRPPFADPTTDANGMASFRLISGDQQTAFLVEVRAPGNDSVERQTFRVRVGPKEEIDYLFIPTYEGVRDIPEAEVFLFNVPGASCADVVIERDLQSGFATAYLGTEYPELAAPTGRDTFVPGRYVPVEFQVRRQGGEERPITVAVALGKRVFYTDRGTPEYELSVLEGCRDNISTGDTNQVLVPMRDLYPSVAGSYTIRSDFNLPTLLPPGLQTIFDAIERLVISPAGFVLDLILGADNSLGGFRGVIEGVLNGLLDTLLPPSWVQGRDDVRNAFDLLRKMPMQGELVIAQEADRDGLLGAANQLRFTQLDIPGASPFSGERALIEGSWSGRLVVVPGPGHDVVLEINETQLAFRVGAVFLELLESLVFPAVTGGSGRVTLEQFARSLIDCNDLARQVAQSIGQNWEGAVRSACNTGVSYFVGEIEDAILGLSIDTANTFQLGTPPGQPCPLFDNPPRRPDFSIDEAGKFSPYAQRCHWQGRVQWTPNQPVSNLEGRWAAGNRRRVQR